MQGAPSRPALLTKCAGAASALATSYFNDTCIETTCCMSAPAEHRKLQGVRSRAVGRGRELLHRPQFPQQIWTVRY